MKKPLLIALILFAFGAVFVSFSWRVGIHQSLYIDATGAHLEDLETKTISSNEPFSSVRINAENIRVEVVPADHYGMEINYVDAEPAWSIDNGTLVIKSHHDSRPHFLGINFGFFADNLIRVYVPSPVETIDISNANGSIEVTHAFASAIILANKNGSIKLQNVNSPAMTLSNKNGSIRAENIIATNLSIANKNGSITVSGDLSGHNKFENKNGSIKLTLAHQNYAYDLQAVHGSIRQAGERRDGVFRAGDLSLAPSISARNTNGSIAIDYSLGL